MADVTAIDPQQVRGMIPWLIRQAAASGQPLPDMPQAGPPAPAPAPAEAAPQPDLSIGAAPQPIQQPASPLDTLTQPPGEAQQAPKLAPETKGHKLLRILMAGAQGGIMGGANNAQTYAQTGRNAGFGGGVYGSMALPLQFQHEALQNQQIQQMLPFLRATQMANLGKIGAETQKLGAEGQKAQAEVMGMPIKQALEQAQTEAANYKEDPNLGLIDLRTKQPVNPSGVAPLTTEEAQVLGKQPGERVPLKIKNTANEIVQRGLGTVAGTNDTFLVNKGTGATRPLGIGSPRAIFAPENRIIQAAPDPNNPGQVQYMKAGEAMRTGALAPGSATVGAAKGIEKSAVSGKIGDEINAFNTALAHADLLRQAAKALNNGDQRTLAGLSNRLETEFGDPRLTDFNAIANAYTREVTKMLSGGHLTDAEIKDQGSTMPSNANYQTIDKVLSSYEALARSKMQQRKNQVERGLKGQPNFPAEQPAGKEIHYKVINGQLVPQ